MTEIERNKAIARRSFEVILPACDVAAMAEVTDPDQRWVVNEVLGDGDLVAIHLTHHGRHTGDLMGIPPTGREVAYDYVHFLRFRDGKAIEQWSVRDDMTLMRQLGVIPDRPQAPAPVEAR